MIKLIISLFKQHKNLLFIGGFCLAVITINAQNKRLDSLLNLSKTAKDTLLVRVYNEISWEYKSSNTDSAFFYARKALTKSVYLNNKLSLAQSYNSLGNIYQTVSKIDSAIFYHNKSLELKIGSKDSIGIADTYNNLGIIADEKGNYLEALQNYFKALKIYEKKSSSFDQIPAVLVNIAIVYKKQKQYKKVLEYYQKALTVYKENNFEIGVVIVTGNIGSVYLKLENYKKAIEFCTAAKEMYTKLGYLRYVPYMDVNIANARFYLGENQKSIQLYKDVINKFNESDNFYELCNAKIGISKPYIATKDYFKANKELEEALQIASSNEFKEFKVDALHQLSELNATLGDFKNAYLFQSEYNIARDSLFEKDKVKSINEILIKYETEKKEKEIAQQRETLLAQELDIKNKNLSVLIVTFVLILLAILFFGIVKKNQIKRKQMQKEIDLKDALAKITTQNRLQEQRLRISRDLHDNIGSQLTFIISSIDNLKYISKNTSDKLKEKLTEITSFTGDTIHQLRDTIWAMNKDNISVEDLNTRVLSFTQKAQKAFPDVQFKLNSNVVGNKYFSSLEGINIFRVIQEAINNSLKYAEANNISINFIEENGIFKVQIKDDGKGFSLDTVNLGNGLSNMEKRMGEIGGLVKINSNLDEGTSINLEFPFKNTTNDV